MGSQDVVDGKGENFEAFMAKRGQVADWKAITKIRQINQEEDRNERNAKGSG
jgi:hypothetical protein